MAKTKVKIVIKKKNVRIKTKSATLKDLYIVKKAIIIAINKVELHNSVKMLKIIDNMNEEILEGK